jgi:hypothetical protein
LKNEKNIILDKESIFSPRKLKKNSKSEIDSVFYKITEQKIFKRKSIKNKTENKNLKIEKDIIEEKNNGVIYSNFLKVYNFIKGLF